MKKLLIPAFLLSCNIHADTSTDNFNKKIELDRIKTMKSQGFNPAGGVTLVDDDAIRFTDVMRSEFDVQNRQQRKKGYYDIYSDRANELIDYAHFVELKYDISKKTTNKDSSVLRKTLEEINFAYEIVPVSSYVATKTYGFAGVNTFKSGWTGFVQYFESDIGNCAFTENNVTLTHQAAKVQRSLAKYDVNKKITTINVIGNMQSGYLYEIDWFDDNYFRTLECATETYDAKTVDKIINMSCEVDLR